MLIFTYVIANDQIIPIEMDKLIELVSLSTIYESYKCHMLLSYLLGLCNKPNTRFDSKFVNNMISINKTALKMAWRLPKKHIFNKKHI